MNLSDLLNSPLMGGVVKNVASQLGLEEGQATSAITTAIPVLLGGMGKNAQTPEGAESLNYALESKHDGSLLTNLLGLNTAELEKDGNGILGHVFGNNVSNVQANVAKKSGISVGKAGSLLAMIAPIVMGYLGKEKRDNNVGAGDLGGLLGSILGGGTEQSATKSGGGIMDMLTGFMDKDNDGSAIDDIFDMFKKR